MRLPARLALAGVIEISIVLGTAQAQQNVAPIPGETAARGGRPPQTAAAPAATGTAGRQARPAAQRRVPFQLNQLELAYLDQVLENWEQQSDTVTTFRCPFERWEFSPVFGPDGPDMKVPLNKNKGQLSYQKPDKGSFQITEIRRWQAEPAPPGEAPPTQIRGDWIVQTDVVGDHWVCDGSSVYEFRHKQKQVVERPIPPSMRGTAIVDGPLPFLFGADADKLKQRYWLRPIQQRQANEIWLQALPRFQAQAADFRAVEVILARESLLPKAMNVHLPDGSRHLYMFDLAKATVNGPLDRLKSLFQAPRTPFRWKHVVDNSMTENQPPPERGRQPQRTGGDVRR